MSSPFDSQIDDTCHNHVKTRDQGISLPFRTASALFQLSFRALDMDEAPCEAEALSKEAERLQQEVETLKAQVKEQPDSKALQGHLKALWPGSDVEMGFQMPISDPMGVAGS